MKFLCDQMLVRLGRWLRAAGYDTVIIESSLKDKQIYKLAQEEQRILLTRDKHFLEFKDSRVIWFQGNTVEECARELSKKIPIDWTKSLFTRCLMCNALLKDADSIDLEELSPNIRNSYQQFWKCETCHQVYWMGSHTKRMCEQLKEWEEANE